MKGQIENENDYLALSSDADRLRLFEEFHRQVVADAQAAAAAAAHHSHHHHKKARKEKKKRKHEKSNAAAASVSLSIRLDRQARLVF